MTIGIMKRLQKRTSKMTKRIKMMAIVRKYYEVDTEDKDVMTRIKEDFDKQKVGDLAFHYFPNSEEVEL